VQLAALAALHRITDDPLALLGSTDRFEQLVTAALVRQAEELRVRHNEELAGRIAEALGG
jgi:hypothetical protein